MSDKPDASYDKARELTETALEEYEKGDTKKGDRLAEQAVQTDRRAVEDVVSEMDEDAAAGKLGTSEAATSGSPGHHPDAPSD